MHDHGNCERCDELEAQLSSIQYDLADERRRFNAVKEALNLMNAAVIEAMLPEVWR